MRLARTRFARDIVAEYYMPKRPSSKVIIFSTGMPSMPRYQHIVEFYGKLGYWVFFPRYRGSWESGGKFLRISPERDILDIIDQLPKGFTDSLTRKKIKIKPEEIFLMSGSFGGPAVILASRDKRVTKVVARCPIVDWLSPSKDEPTIEYEGILRETFGDAYRFSHRDWQKLSTGKFYNPAAVSKDIDGSKLLLIHAKDDTIVSYRSVKKFAAETGSRLVTLPRGGHLSSKIFLQPRFVKMITKFFKE
jgi:alpha-beta hydrolase superfamily lysophospholipase